MFSRKVPSQTIDQTEIFPPLPKTFKQPNVVTQVPRAVEKHWKENGLKRVEYHLHLKTTHKAGARGWRRVK